MFVECRHILPRGTKCKGAALRGRPYCYFHDQLHTYAQDGLRDDDGVFSLPSIEDASGIQLALMQVMNAMANGRLQSREGVRLIYGLQVALQAFDRVPKTPPQEIVQATQCDGVGIDIAYSEGEPGQPHPECPACVKRHGCQNIDRQNKKSLRDLYDEARDRRERAEREPLALPASGAPAGPDPQASGSREPERALARGEEEQGSPEPALVREAAAAPLAVSSSCAAWAPDPHRPRVESPHKLDPQKEAALAARINKFRPDQREADRIAREKELSRRIADHEITLDEAFALPAGSPLPLPASRRKNRDG